MKIVSRGTQEQRPFGDWVGADCNLCVCVCVFVCACVCHMRWDLKLCRSANNRMLNIRDTEWLQGCIILPNLQNSINTFSYYTRIAYQWRIIPYGTSQKSVWPIPGDTEWLQGCLFLPNLQSWTKEILNGCKSAYCKGFDSITLRGDSIREGWLDNIEGWLNNAQGWLNNTQGWLNNAQGWLQECSGVTR